jgi:single-stranded-DNA-specific exonuclease
MARSKWEFRKTDKQAAADIAEKYNIDGFAALILSSRQGSDEQLQDFLGNNGPADPFELPDMQKAVDAVNDAIFDFRRICVFGDYDADGVTAAALLYSYLQAQGADAVYLLPDRIEDGYGLSRKVCDKINALGAKLVITVDNGISAADETEYLKTLGIQTVITDHHLPPEVLPDALAVVDPHRSDSTCSYKDYSGAGVALKLCCAVEGNENTIMSQYADLAALGTVADVVPLTGDNRYIVRKGLELLNRNERPGTVALAKAAGCAEKKITSETVSFILGPRINACGRMGSAVRALDLLLCEDPDTCNELAAEINDLNTKRHEAENEIYSKAKEYIKEHPETEYAPVITVAGEGLAQGVIGIAAAKLASEYARPAVVISYEGENARASARSIEGFELHDAFEKVSSDLSGFGGHALAAGCSLKTENIPAFIAHLNEYAASQSFTYPVLRIDCRLNPDAVNTDLTDAMQILEPYGSGNPVPVFALTDMVIISVTAMGDKKQHIRINARKSSGSGTVTAIKFNMTAEELMYGPGDNVDMAVTLSESEYMGTRRISIFLREIRPKGSDDSTLPDQVGIYRNIMGHRKITKEQSETALPLRSEFAAVYRTVKKAGKIKNDNEYISFCAGLGSGGRCKTAVALSAFIQLGLAECKDGYIMCTDTDEKADIFSAPAVIAAAGEEI